MDFGWRQPDFEGGWEEKLGLNGVRERPVGDIAHPGFLDMVVDKGLMESFARFRHVVVIWWQSQCFVGINGELFHCPPIDHNFRYGLTKNSKKCMESTSNGT